MICTVIQAADINTRSNCGVPCAWRATSPSEERRGSSSRRFKSALTTQAVAVENKRCFNVAMLTERREERVKMSVLKDTLRLFRKCQVLLPKYGSSRPRSLSKVESIASRCSILFQIWCHHTTSSPETKRGSKTYALCSIDVGFPLNHYRDIECGPDGHPCPLPVAPLSSSLDQNTKFPSFQSLKFHVK